MEEAIIIEAMDAFITILVSEIYCVRIPKLAFKGDAFCCLIYMKSYVGTEKIAPFTVTLDSANKASIALQIRNKKDNDENDNKRIQSI